MQVKIKTEKGEFLAVKVPDEAEDFIVDEDGLNMFQNPPHSDMTLGNIELPPGNWQLIGACKELTDEQWKGVVDEVSSWGKTYFKNYGGKYSYNESMSSAESGMTLLLLNNVYFTNPFPSGKPSMLNHDVWYSEKDWQEAEKRTGNWVLIKMISSQPPPSGPV